MNDTILEQLALAERYLDIEQPQRAAETMRSLPAEAFDLSRTWWLRAAVARDLQGPKAALEVLQAGLARFPHSMGLLILLGNVLVKLRHLEEAEDVLLRALAVDPENVEALCDYAIVVALVGQFRKGDALVARAASIDPEAGDVWVARYQIAHFRGDDRTTRRLARELARQSDGHGRAVAVLAVEAAKVGDHRGAWRLLRQAASADASVVDLFGREGMLEARALHHPLLIAMWPVERFGPGTVWIVCIGGIYALETLGARPDIVLYAVGAFILYAVYTWVAPPLVRWLTGAPQ
ncbi:MAG: tetratricopeptide repeat protein [Myxococcota bacterium]